LIKAHFLGRVHTMRVNHKDLDKLRLEHKAYIFRKFFVLDITQ
jgi:hypothetical protein